MIGNIKAIKSSLDTDKYVYRWFISLICHPLVELSLHDGSKISGLYSCLKRSVFRQRALLAAFLLCLLSSIAVNKALGLVGALLCLYDYIKCSIQTKTYIVEISISLLFKDFKQEGLSKLTIYQIAEIYSRKYNIPSLVDAMCSLHKIESIFILSGIVFMQMFFEIKMATLNKLILIGMAHFIIRKIINLPFFYKRFK